MKMFKHILFSIMSITLFAMCKKSGYGYVRGTIIEKGTGATVAGITVYLTDTKYGSTHHNQTASAVSDAAGNYYIKYFKIPTHRYFITCDKDDIYNGFGTKEITYTKTAVTIELEPSAYIRIRIKKNANSQHYIKARINGNIDLGYLYNQNIYDTLLPKTYKVLGNTTNMVEWYVYEPSNSSHTSNYDRIYIPKNDTVTYLIQFN